MHCPDSSGYCTIWHNLDPAEYLFKINLYLDNFRIVKFSAESAYTFKRERARTSECTLFHCSKLHTYNNPIIADWLYLWGQLGVYSVQHTLTVSP